MHNPSVNDEQSGRWDGPWYRVRTEHFEAAFLPDATEDLAVVDNVDVFVDLNDGTRWSGTVFSLAQVDAIMSRHEVSGENLGGSYFWCSDGLIVREAGIAKMTQVLVGLVESGEFKQILRRIED
jgi:hypothetical protein